MYFPTPNVIDKDYLNPLTCTDMKPAQNPNKPQHEIHHAILKTAIGVCVYYKNHCLCCHVFLLLRYLTNKETSTVLCSVVRHAGSGRIRKKCRGQRET